jgi:hypothetical protein
MSAITTYTLRAASADALHALLVAASAGGERPYAWMDGDARRYDEARVRLPYPEFMADGADPETDAPIYAPTGYWLCAVMLVDTVDAALAALAAAE